MELHQWFTYFEITLTSAETTLIGTLICMFKGQKMHYCFVNHSILKKKLLLRAHLKMVPVISLPFIHGTGISGPTLFKQSLSKVAACIT